MIIGSAGHIDHGKTALVHALTGVDTDRLKEEKARGITIELGYAYQPMDNNEVLGFIDVPGHERFIHTMLAGAAGIDFALLVVAADDGIMPQTREHLDILDLLGVRRGAVALTKIDRVEAGRAAAVTTEIQALLTSTALAGSPIFPVCALDGCGIPALLAYLHAQAQTLPAHAAEGGFRLAVDRSFSLKGIGTVVTGTVFAGRVAVGDELAVTPTGILVRLRGLHVMNRPAQQGQAGQRCALNLAGVDKADIQRGDWIVAPWLDAPTNRFDVRLNLSPNAPHPLKHWAPVHLHLGAAHVMARVALLEGETLVPGGSALAQLVTDHPIAALHNDGFILRDAEARHTLGGGRVLDPWGPSRKRNTGERLAELAALEAPEPADRLATLLQAAAWGLDLGRLNLAWNRPDLAGLLPGSARPISVAGQTLAFADNHWQTLGERLLAGLKGFHAQFPDELGPDAARARRMFLAKLPAPAFAALVDHLLAQDRLRRSGPWLHLSEHRISLTASEQTLYERIRPWLAESHYDPPWVRDLAKRSGTDEAHMRQLMQKLARQGEVFQIVRDLFYPPSAVAELAAILSELEAAEGAAAVAAFRDRTGIGRKRSVQILEFFDRVGYTRRVGEAHRLRNPDMFNPEGKNLALK